MTKNNSRKAAPKAKARPVMAAPEKAKYPEPDMPSFYGNVVVSNFTPYDLDLIFAKGGLPATLPSGVGAKWHENMKFVARVSVPLAVVPALIRLLQNQWDQAQELKTEGQRELEEAKK